LTFFSLSANAFGNGLNLSRAQTHARQFTHYTLGFHKRKMSGEQGYSAFYAVRNLTL
jgi:hypothetical protein